MEIKRQMSSPAQQLFLEQLFIDCGFHTRLERLDFMSRYCKREIKGYNETTMQEVSAMITELKEMKNNAKGRSEGEVED